MNEELKHSRIDAAQASGNDLPPIQTDETPIPPQEKAMKGIKEPSASPCDPNAVAGKPVVSIQKLEANRKNGEKSTGPRTDAGKEKAAANSYKHGLFANRLFPPGEQGVKDKAGYLAAANSLHMHYRPEGLMKEFWVEKIAIEALRLARVLGYEQKTTMLSWRYPFDLLSGDRLLRYQTALNRQLLRAIEELERLQAKRKVEQVLTGRLELGANDTGAEGERSTQCSAGQADEVSTDKAIAESESTVTAVEGLSDESDVYRSDAAASAESGGTNPPAVDGSGQTTSPSPKASDGRPKFRNFMSQVPMPGKKNLRRWDALRIQTRTKV